MADAIKDWSGNTRSAFTTIGARNNTKYDRAAYDYYATEPKAARLLMEVEEFSPVIWECACGEGHLVREFEKAGYIVYASDLIDRGLGTQLDFLTTASPPVKGMDIVTNPPYSIAREFIEHALEISPDGTKVAMFLKIQFLESKGRKPFFLKYPPKTIYVSSDRLHCALNGDFVRYSKSNAICYAWFIWVKGYAGETVVKWIN